MMKKIILRLLAIVAFLVTAWSGVMVYQGYVMYKEAIEAVPITEKLDPILQSEQFVSIDELPDMYTKAVLTIEDKRFYEHNGVDILAIMRALKNDIIAMSFVEGGSTITQQIAKNEYFTQDKEIPRKIAEVFMAFEIEQHYTKDEIFEIYVNTIFFGETYYGISAASEGYYHIPPSEMNDYQSTMMAGVPNAPSVYAPTVNLDLARQRQKQVLDKMVKNKVLTQQEADAIEAQGEDVVYY